MVDFMQCPTNLLFFGIPLLYYYTNFNLSIICFLFWEICILIHTHFLSTNLSSSIICFLSSGDMYLFLVGDISTSSSVSLWILLLSLLLGNFLEGSFIAGFFFETLVSLSAILLLIKSPVASAVF